MMNLNRIEVIGNLTKDPELRYTPTNQAVVSFSIATNRSYKDQAGAWIESPPEYHEIVVWGQLAERCNQVLHRGERIYVTGRLQTRSWEAQDGGKRYKTEVIADGVIGPDLVNKSQGGDRSAFSGPVSEPLADKPAIKKSAAPASEDEINIDDIPF